MSDSINTINVGGVSKEIEDTIARTGTTSANARLNVVESKLTGLEVRVDEIIAPTGEAPNPDEIIDARVGADGVRYTSLGEAIRTQFDDLTSSISFVDGCPFIKELYINKNGVNDNVEAINNIYLNPQTNNYEVYFMDRGGTRTTAAALIPANNQNQIAPIWYNAVDNIYGYILMSFDWMTSDRSTITKPLKSACYDMEYSPSIYNMIYSSDVFVKGCPFIRELYINELGVEAGITGINNVYLNSSTNKYEVYFMNESSGNVAVAYAPANNPEQIVPIIYNTKIYGFVLMAFDWMGSNNETIGMPLNKKCYKAEYSPTIYSEYVKGSIFVDNCPFVKELFINEDGINAGLATLHNIDNTNRHLIGFSNASKDAYVGYAVYRNTNSLYEVTPIGNREGGSHSAIYGYILVDWSKVTEDEVLLQSIKQPAKNIEFSPSIKTKTQSSSVETDIELLNTKTNALQSSVNAEIANRESGDSLLGRRIDNLVAPTGESVAEIIDARVGYSGTTYQTLESRLNAEYEMLYKKTYKVRTVGSGQEYQTIRDAVNAASSGDVILIYPGTYHENLKITDKYILLMGLHRDNTIVEYENGDYGKPPIEMSKGIMMNLTFHAIQQASQGSVYGKAYAFHIDFQGSGVIGNNFYAENCKFINDDYRAVGLGTRGQAHIEFNNCEFNSLTESNALYFHDANDTSYDISGQSLSFRNCTFINNSSSAPTIDAYTMERRSKVATIEWQRNIVANKSSGGLVKMTFYQGRSPIDGNGWLGSSDWVLRETSALNNVNTLNR